MKIAVTYDHGNVFQHFGRTEEFKVYDVEDGRVVSSEVVGSDGLGHGALAGLLADHAIDVLICGGIGGGARDALQAAGIELCAGAEGSADQAVEAYLKGELISSDAVCDHHHGEGHNCGHHEHGNGQGCGQHGEEPENTRGSGCCGHHGESHEDPRHGSGCCGHHSEESDRSSSSGTKSGRNTGKTCRVHYRGTFNDGTQFDSSYDRGEPLEFVCGAGMMIPGFDAAVADMEPGQALDVHLMPEEAYGMPDPNAVFTVDVNQMRGAENLTLGQQVYLYNSMGQPFPAKVTARVGDSITFDANHEMAGKELNFRIELVEVK